MPAPAAVNAPTIVVTIDNRQPVELVDFTKSLLSLADQFKRDAAFSEGSELDVKLFVKELRPGSIVAELVPIADNALAAAGPAIAVAAAHANEIVDTVSKFVDNFKKVKEWLVDGAPKPEIADAKRAENFANIVGPVAKDTGATIKIEVNAPVNAPITVHAPITISSMEANAGQNRAAEHIKQLKTPQAEVLSQVMMTLYQVTKAQDNEKGIGEQAIIEAVRPKPAKVSFATKALRDTILGTDQNLFHEVFVVDVEVQRVHGKIARYYVTQLHERFRLDEEDDAEPEVT